MPRNCEDWLTSYREFTTGGEAPSHFHTWCGASAIAAVLQRRAWLDMVRFRWYPNMFVLLIAPPGIVQKSTTIDLSMSLLKEVPGVTFGPHIATWESLVARFGTSLTKFDYQDKTYVHSSLTLAAGEFGNLFDPDDRKLVDVFVRLWDCPDGPFNKETKGSGCDSVLNPWINMVAATTLSWIGENCSRYIIGGGFLSRCIIVYADKKQNLIAYPDEHFVENYASRRAALIADLVDMQENIIGEFKVTADAREWGREWYRQHYEEDAKQMNMALFGGYLSRKQAHIHKLAMINSASKGNNRTISLNDLQTAEMFVTELEEPMRTVFESVGKSDLAHRSDIIISELRRCGEIPYQKFCARVITHFPSNKDLEDAVMALQQAGIIKRGQVGMSWVIKLL